MIPVFTFIHGNN